MDFYLGTHRASWLALTDVPLFVSAVQLRKRRTFPKAKGRWAKDSGGFSVLLALGYWPFDDPTYAEETRREAEAVGMPDFVAIRDWMCEPQVRAKTGKTIAEHQKRTIDSYAALRELAPEIPWMPVVQGWHPDEYESHVEQYKTAGFDLRACPRVGVGSVCRRQGTRDGANIINRVADLGICVHAFGVKVEGLALYGHRIASADSMTWSFVARRRNIKMPGCVGHRNCANYFAWAHEWHRTRILNPQRQPVQLSLFGGAA